MNTIPTLRPESQRQISIKLSQTSSSVFIVCGLYPHCIFIKRNLNKLLPPDLKHCKEGYSATRVAVLRKKKYNGMAHSNILLLPIEELCSHSRQARNWQGCCPLFKATWARQTPIATDAADTFPGVTQGQLLPPQGRSEEPESLMCLSSSPRRFYSENCHGSFRRKTGRQHETCSNVPVAQLSTTLFLPLIFLHQRVWRPSPLTLTETGITLD